MNFFNFGSGESQSQSSANFNLHEASDFQFNQDTFGPNGYNQQETCFVFSPQESKEPLQQNQFQFNFAESNQSIGLNSSEPLCFQLTSQASFSDCVFGNDKSQEDQSFISQTNIPDIKLNSEESNGLGIKNQVQQSSINCQINQPLQDLSIKERSINVSNALKELESLMNKNTPTNVSIKDNIVAYPQRKDIISQVSVDHHQQKNIQPATKRLESKISYFMNTCSQESQETEEPNRKRTFEYIEEEKKCPKFENKFSEMKFFEKNPQDTIEQKQIVKDNQNNQTSFKQNTDQSNINISSISNSGLNSNVINTKQTAPIKTNNQQPSMPINPNSINTANKIPNQKIQPKQIVQPQRQSSYKNNSNIQPQQKNIKGNKRTMMPPIEEVTENENESELEGKVNYEEKLKFFKEKFLSLQAKVNSIRQKSKQSSSLYEIFGNYITQSEHFNINFRTFFKVYIKNYSELLQSYSKLFLNLNSAHKIDKKCQELRSIFTKLKEKIPID